MAERKIEELLGEHHFFEGMDASYLAFIAGCAQNLAFDTGEMIARNGEEARAFYAIRHGRVSVEVYSPQRGSLTVQTIVEGGVVGWSWIFPPYRWIFDVRALEPTRVVHFDATCLREKCESDPKMGFEFMKRFARVATSRLEATQLQLLDVYGRAQDDARGQA